MVGWSKEVKEAWTDDHEAIVRLQVQYGIKEHLPNFLSSTLFVPNTPAFPPGEFRRYANDRRQKALKARRRGTHWTTPCFSCTLRRKFEWGEGKNYYLKLLFAAANGTEPPTPPSSPEPSNMAPPRSGRSNNSTESREARASADDESVEASYTNEGAEEVTTAMSRLAMPRGVPRDISPQPSRQGSKFQLAANILALKVGAGVKNPFKFTVSTTSTKMSDDGQFTLCALTMKIPIASPLDYEHVSTIIYCAPTHAAHKICTHIYCSCLRQHKLRFHKGGSMVTKNGDEVFSCIEFTQPVVSAAEQKDVMQIAEYFHADTLAANEGNTAIHEVEHNAAAVSRKAGMDGSISDAYNEDKTVKTKTVVLRLPVDPETKKQFFCDNKNWQGGTYKLKPVDNYFIKTHFEPLKFREKLPGDDSVTYNGWRFCIMVEIPIYGKELAKLDLTPTRKVISQKDKFARAQELFGAEEAAEMNTEEGEGE